MFKGKYLQVLIAMCGITAAVLGLLTNVAGVFFTPIAEDFGIGKGSVSLTLTISNLSFALGGMAATKRLNGNSFKKIMFIGMLGFAGSTALLATAGNVYLLYVLNVIRGFCAGLSGIVIATIVINNWFHSNTSLVTSIAFGCSGLAGALFSVVLTSIISSLGWRMGYVIVAILICVFYLPVLLFPIGLSPEDVNAVPYGTKETVSVSSESKQSSGISASLVVLVLLYAVFSSFATAVPQHFPGIAESYQLSVGALMLSVCMIMNTCGKLILGVLIETIGTMKAVILYLVLILAASLGILFVHQPFVMLVCAGLIGLSYGLGTVGVTTITREKFGNDNYGNVYPKISLGTTISNAVGSSLVGYIYDFTGSYNLVLIMIACFVSVSVLIVIQCYGKKERV